MYRLFAFSLALVACLALPVIAYASPPPAYGGYLPGWGMNPNEWNDYSGSFTSFGIYDPTGVQGGAGWVVGWEPITHITYAPITLEMWIEMYCVQTYHYTSYKWHRLGSHAENLCFTVEGTLQSNNGQYVSLTRGTEDLTNLWFRHNIFGGSSPTPAPNIPIAWTGRWGTGLAYGQNLIWEGGVTPDPDVTILIPDPCDHWFQFEGCMSIPYHQPDGYYSLTMAGCPAPVL